MAPAAENNKDEPSWYSKLGAALHSLGSPCAGKEAWMVNCGDCVSPERLGDAPAEPRQWQAFAFAEAMELGAATGPAAAFIEPPAQIEEQRLVVERSKCQSKYTLLQGNRTPILVALLAADGCRIDIFSGDPSEHTVAVLGPAFTLRSTSSARSGWILSSARCERCEARGARHCAPRELLRTTQYVEAIGEGQALCMDVLLSQARADGSSASNCECSGSPADRPLLLTVRRPRWNARHKSLTLDFKSRVTLASAKNFQLEDPREPSKVKMLYGKIGENRFTLDHRYPLGTVQAFAAALSASHWE